MFPSSPHIELNTYRMPFNTQPQKATATTPLVTGLWRKTQKKSQPRPHDGNAKTFSHLPGSSEDFRKPQTFS
ncbi:hypothetical protein QQF64_001620 [Cirrhinus molitorella]|uniref:Uncharacterized protein n=1 Tax=Cirrhinus molitorella TaxID=172907 RepID=A0ABR3P121_9TELE